tara:strand:+ start:30 stop:617 length:588 start_codon:yes stop_codon:yes gene_type:complete
MKYVDKNITVEAAKINFFDTDRPGPALTRMFNPPKNILRAQSASLVNRIIGITHEMTEKINLGILDASLHCILPSVIFYRKKKYKDTSHILSNNLVVRQSELARNLIEDSRPRFYKTQVDILDSIFKESGFIILIINIDDIKQIMTAIDRIKKRKGIISIHNPEHKENSKIIKYSLDRQIHLIEHTDNSCDIIRI